jgi:hypothetical protein
MRKSIFIFLTVALFFAACTEEIETGPTLRTLTAVDTDITTTTAILKGEILTLGNMNIIEHGIEISKSLLFTSPIREGITVTPVTGVYPVEFTGLEPGTLYYFRAYVLINTAYLYPQGTPPNFTTK